MAKKTHNEFLSILFNNNKYYRDGALEIIGKYSGNKLNILLKDEFGEVLVAPSNLYRGSRTTIKAAIDKTSYFKNQALSKNSFYKDGSFELLGYYEDLPRHFRVLDKYGEGILNKTAILEGNNSHIGGAVDKAEYFRNEMRELFSSNNYDDTKYLGARKNVDIECKIHGIFTQRASHHRRGHGCKECGHEKTGCVNWVNLSDKDGTLYIIKCSNASEVFYKVGITEKTLKERFAGERAMPYEYSYVFLETLWDRAFISRKESFVKRTMFKKGFQYLPTKSFGGYSTECFTKDSLPTLLQSIEEFDRRERDLYYEKIECQKIFYEENPCEFYK